MTDGIKFTVKNLEEVKKFIMELPRGVKIAAMRAFSEYVVGNERHGLRHEAPQRFVSRAAAYGKVSDDAPAGYFSMKQFRYVAAITKGFTQVPWTRKHEIAPAWRVEESNSDWTRVQLVNDKDGVQYVYGNQMQARQPALVGWRKLQNVISDNMAGAMLAANRAVNKYLKEKSK